MLSTPLPHIPAGQRRVAVIGAGPAGLQSAQALLEAEVAVDIIDELPTPYGLVRYGVAPDHQNMKACMNVLQRVFPAGAGFIGNVNVGSNVTVEQLLDHYDALVFCTGCEVDRRLGISGEDLRGAVGSRSISNWYSGHPTSVGWSPVLETRAAAVIGAGNVALDIARVLGQSPETLRGTDIPERVLAELRRSSIREVHLIIRRGPAETRFTPSELTEIGDLKDVGIRVHDDGLLAEIDETTLDRVQAQNIRTLREWAEAVPGSQSRWIHLHFHRRPIRVEGEKHASALVVESTLPADNRDDGQRTVETIQTGLVVRAISYRVEPIPGLPPPSPDGVIPNEHGRVLGQSGTLAGVYVAGWAKRGPNGRIGTNRNDAKETVTALLDDLSPTAGTPRHSRAEFLEFLGRAGVETVDHEGWLRIDSMERELGAERGADRAKVAERSIMLQAAADRIPAQQRQR